ncbi:pyroglutamylated RF-amide peptide receptor-like [Oculina patagonica]
MSELAGVAITTVLSILVIVDIVGNSLVCLIIKRNRDMRTPINYLLVNLAVADIMYATFIAPRLVIKLTTANHPDGMTGTVLCKLLTYGNVAWVAGASTFVTLAAIAIERYHAVIYPHGYKAKLTQCKLKVVIFSSWLFALVLNTPFFLFVGIKKEQSSIFCVTIWPEDWIGKANSWVWLALGLILPLALMIALYSKVVHTLWCKGTGESRLDHQQRGVMRVRKRVTLMAVIVTAIFGICWGANTIEYVLRYLPFVSISPVVSPTVDTMVLFNSAFNPFVYALLSQQFREKMRRVIYCTDCYVTRIRPTQGPQDLRLAELTI